MYTYSKGLYNNFVIKNDIPIAKYKPYNYTNKDFNNLNFKNKIPLIFLQTNLNIKKINSTLFVANDTLDVTNILIKDVMDFLIEKNIDVKLLAGYEQIAYCPALLLSDFNNINTIFFKGEKSPLKINDLSLENKTVYSINDIIITKQIFDLTTNTRKSFTEDASFLYFEPSDQTSGILKVLSNTFYLYGDTNIKTVVDGKEAGVLLAHGDIV